MLFVLHFFSPSELTHFHDILAGNDNEATDLKFYRLFQEANMPHARIEYTAIGVVLRKCVTNNSFVFRVQLIHTNLHAILDIIEHFET